MASSRIDGPLWAPTALGTVGPTALLGEYVRRGDRLIYSPFRVWYEKVDTVRDALTEFCRDSQRTQPFAPPAHAEGWFRYSSDQSELAQFDEIADKVGGNVPVLAVLVQRDATSDTLLGFSLATPWHADDRLAFVQYVWTNEKARRQLTEAEYRTVRLGLMSKLATALARSGVLAVTALLPSPAKLGQLVSPYRAAFAMTDVLEEHGLSDTVGPGKLVPHVAEFRSIISKGRVDRVDLQCENDSPTSRAQARRLIADALDKKARARGWEASHAGDSPDSIEVSAKILLDATVSFTVGPTAVSSPSEANVAASSFRAPLAHLADHLRRESQ